MKTLLYLGLDPPKRDDVKVIHCPLIEIIFRPKDSPDIVRALEYLPKVTHYIVTSKSAASALFALGCDKSKMFLSVGKATTDMLAGVKNILTAKQECQEGIIELIDTLNLETAVGAGQKAQSFEPQSLGMGAAFTSWECSAPIPSDSDSKSCTFWRGLTAVSRLNFDSPLFFWGHSSLSRSTLHDYILEKKLPLIECILYETRFKAPKETIDLKQVDEIFFTSPSTVEAFYHFFGPPPKHAHLVTRGQESEKALHCYSKYS